MSYYNTSPQIDPSASRFTEQRAINTLNTGQCRMQGRHFT